MQIMLRFLIGAGNDLTSSCWHDLAEARLLYSSVYAGLRLPSLLVLGTIAAVRGAEWS